MKSMSALSTKHEGWFTSCWVKCCIFKCCYICSQLLSLCSLFCSSIVRRQIEFIRLSLDRFHSFFLCFFDQLTVKQLFAEIVMPFITAIRFECYLVCKLVKLSHFRGYFIHKNFRILLWLRENIVCWTLMYLWKGLFMIICGIQKRTLIEWSSLVWFVNVFVFCLLVR